MTDNIQHRLSISTKMLPNSVILLAFTIIFVPLNTATPTETITFDQFTSNNHTQITNISTAVHGQFPHQVSLRKRENDKHICSGAIINGRWILTAARCVISRVPYTIVAVVGTLELSTGGKAYEIVLSIQHTNFKRNPLDNDIALLRTQTQIVFDEFVQPIALPMENTVIEMAGIFAGWGIQGGNFDDVPNSLQYVETMIFSSDGCKRLLPSTVYVDFDGIVCRCDGTTFRETGEDLQGNCCVDRYEI